MLILALINILLSIIIVNYFIRDQNDIVSIIIGSFIVSVLGIMALVIIYTSLRRFINKSRGSKEARQ